MNAPDRPASRRERPAKPALTRAGIVEVALRVMADEGLEKVTMRRIATELDTGPASLYVYVDNTAELHGAILDELLADIALPRRPRAASWRATVVRLLVDYTEVLFAQPSLARSVVTLRPSGPHYLDLLDALLAAMRTGGVPARQAAWGVDLLLQQASAIAAEHATRRDAIEARHEEQEQVLAVHAADGTRSGIAWARADLFAGSGQERLVWAFEALLTGIAAVAPPH